MSDKVIQFEKKEQPKEPKNVFELIAEETQKVNPALGGMDELALILSLPDEQFAILKPVFLDELKKSFDNPADKILLAQAMQDSGTSVQQLQESYNTLIEEIDNQFQDTLSRDKREFLKEMIGITINGVCDSRMDGKILNIPIELCRPEAKIPVYAHGGDAGLDIYALEDYEIKPGETKLIPTGLKVAIPEGYELQIRPKSGRALKTKLRVANSPATIDSSYTGEIGVIIENVEAPIKDITYDFDDNGRPIISSILHGRSYFIGKGEKFAQLVLNEVPTANFYQVEKIEKHTERGSGGYGSSGLK